MSALIESHLVKLIGSLGRTRPPINPATLKRLYKNKDYPAMLGWIKNTMHIDLRVGLRIVESAAPSAPMWIETPSTMPRYGSEEFRQTRVVVNVRRDLLEKKPFEWVVAGFAHELSHVVLFSIGHELQNEEKAVDLTAMILGYRQFVANARTRVVTRSPWPILNIIFWILIGAFLWEGTKGDDVWILPLVIGLFVAVWALSYWQGISKRTEWIGYLDANELSFANSYLSKRVA